jgi:cell division protease FtsH
MLVIILINVLAVRLLLNSQPAHTEVSYTFFRQQVQAGNVNEISSSADTIQGTFRQAVHPTDAAANSTPVTAFSTVRPAFADAGLETMLDDQGVTINAKPVVEPPDPIQSALLSFGPALLLIGALVWVVSRTASVGTNSVTGLGKSQARRYDEASSRRVTFGDVAGIDEARDELVEIVDFLKEPQRYTRLGGSAPKGVLLVGAPGTGKTLLARAVAGEANVPFFSMGASEFVEMIVGVGASRVRDLFKQARVAAPAIVFVDELDAVGRARGSSPLTGGNAEQEQTLNQILLEMDSFTGREGVIVLAATNRPDMLDPALLRPGRFDRRVIVQTPDRSGRASILGVHTAGMPLAGDVDLGELARATPGLVGADLRNLANEAALLAARRRQDQVRRADFLDALEKITLGPARPLVMSPDERQRVAYHEGGHTILGLLLPGADPVNRVTIVPHGMAMGVTYQRPDDDRHNYSREYLVARIVSAMGGRAAEEIVFDTVTTGAENDMEQATNLARQMVTRWGMSPRRGPVTLAPRDSAFLPGQDAPGGSGPYSESTASLVDAEVQRILQEAHELGVHLLREHRGELDRLAAALLEHETLEEQAILQVTALRPAPKIVSPSKLPAAA